MNIRNLIFALIFLAAAHCHAQNLVDHKGTKIRVDSSKWNKSNSLTYNKTPGTVGIGTGNAADTNAALEVRSANKGVLIPRLTLSSRTNASPLAAHVAGMLVYNTATAGTSPNNVYPGFYYNTGSLWMRVQGETGSAADSTNDSWKDDAGNDQVRLAYYSDGSTARTPGTEFTINDNGQVGIGTDAPSWLLDVQGPAALGQFRRIGGSYTQGAGLLFTRTLGSTGAESDITAGSFLGKIQFRGRLSGADADYASLMYKADATSAGGGHFAFTKSDLLTEILSVRTDNNRVGVGESDPNSTFEINGSFAANIRSISTATTLDDTYCYVVMESGSSLTLPAASTCPGRVYHIKNDSGSNKTIVLSGTSTLLRNNYTMTCVSDGSTWHRFGTAP